MTERRQQVSTDERAARAAACPPTRRGCKRCPSWWRAGADGAPPSPVFVALPARGGDRPGADAGRRARARGRARGCCRGSARAARRACRFSRRPDATDPALMAPGPVRPPRAAGQRARGRRRGPSTSMILTRPRLRSAGPPPGLRRAVTTTKAAGAAGAPRAAGFLVGVAYDFQNRRRLAQAGAADCRRRFAWSPSAGSCVVAGRSRVIPPGHRACRCCWRCS